jgi:hypothetical protein
MVTQVESTTGQDFISPLPPTVAPVENHIVITPAPAREEIQEVNEPSIYAVLRDRLGISQGILAKVSDADIEQIIEQNAERLQVDVYRLIGDEMVLVAKGRTDKTPLPLNPLPWPEPTVTVAEENLVQTSSGNYKPVSYTHLTLPTKA